MNLSIKNNFLSYGSKKGSLGLSYGKRVSRFRGSGAKNLSRLLDLKKLI